MGLNTKNLCQIEIEVADIDRSIRFYQNVFGWEPVPAEIFEVTVLSVPADCPYGISLVKKSHPSPRANGVILYLSVTNPDEILKKVTEFDGTICFGPKKLHGYGEIYHVSDPSGIRWGLFVDPKTRPAMG